MEISGRYRKYFEIIQKITEERAFLQKEIDTLNGEIATAKLKSTSSLPSLSTRLRTKVRMLQNNEKTAQNLTEQRNQLFLTINTEIKTIYPNYRFDENGNLLDEYGKILDPSFTVTKV
ncbi:MAG: hypothetical protein ACOYK6_00535 [Chthoniobacterales bacterium]